jgi:hypothetical protein
MRERKKFRFQVSRIASAVVPPSSRGEARGIRPTAPRSLPYDARTATLDQELADLARRHHHGTGTTVMDWEYLLLTARKQPE